ncbi:MAG: VWA domain-containing protein [Pirellulaceae bacterium]|nr:VWA domain-containing protein [Pirellulaceae bacterium]
MEWNNPQSLYLILPIALAWLMLAVYSDRRRRRAREAFVAQAMWSRILPEDSQVRFWFKQLLRLVAIVASLTALAGPRFGSEIEKIVPRGSDLYVLIDVSRSMLAQDVPPSRLGRAKADVAALVNRLEGERVGLIAFAGQAVVKCPLTVDYDSFRRALDELDPSSAPRGGTAIGDAIRKALDVFQGKVDRDQAMLLITDGDDQQSYPLEAADVAAEHHVTIFAIGLGDSDQGARIPGKDDSTGFVEYQGEQVWSKLDGTLLSEIALKTSGVYVPAGTKSYDLGELYADHLRNRHAKNAATQERSRRSEQFQIFLAVAFFALLIELCISPYRRTAITREVRTPALQSVPRQSLGTTWWRSIAIAFLCVGFAGAVENRMTIAAEPYAAIREGLQFYKQEKYDTAIEKFQAAAEELDKQKSNQAAIAAFDEACALHRKGDIEKARESYLRAGLSQDRKLAIIAHFNLGTLSAEQARQEAGEQPELVEPEKRPKILEHLMQATAAYRHCLELQPEYVLARSNLELVRQWIKYYSDKWRELDRQKQRDESNLLVFLQFMIDAQEALKETIKNLAKNASADTFVELKQTQSELGEEIPTLKDKIEKELRPSTSPSPNNTVAPNPSPDESKELEEGIRMLQSWADAASIQMTDASRSLVKKATAEAIEHQDGAILELDKIWDAVVPFHPLLTRELAEQTTIATTLNPNPPSNSNDKREEDKPTDTRDDLKAKSTGTVADNTNDAQAKPDQLLVIAENDLKLLVEKQGRTLRKSRLLLPKAEMELKQLENSPPPTASPTQTEPDPDAPSEPSKEIDPEEIKEGYRKAIELAPQAVEQMESAIQFLKQKETLKAAEGAEEARRILEEIQKAQPKKKQDPNQDQKQDQKQDQQDQNKNDEDKKDDENKKEQENKDQQKSESDKQDQNKPDEKKDENKDPKKEEQPPRISPDRMEEALRKVRERQEEKRERDRELQAKILGRIPVEKDW